MTTEPYDKTEVYDAKIKPLLRKVLSICLEHDIGVFCSAVLKVVEPGTGEEDVLVASSGYVDSDVMPDPVIRHMVNHIDIDYGKDYCRNHSGEDIVQIDDGTLAEA